MATALLFSLFLSEVCSHGYPQHFWNTGASAAATISTKGFLFLAQHFCRKKNTSAGHQIQKDTAREFCNIIFCSFNGRTFVWTFRASCPEKDACSVASLRICSFSFHRIHQISTVRKKTVCRMHKDKNIFEFDVCELKNMIEHVLSFLHFHSSVKDLFV